MNSFKVFKYSFLLLISFCFSFDLKQNLSEYKIYKGDPRNLIPNDNFIVYDLITPLFTDYAFKNRLIYIPEGKKIEYHDRDVFDFPEGTIIVKTFYYPHNFNDINSAIDLVETRLLVHEEKGWKAYPYIWNDLDNDAVLSVAGGIIPVSWKSNNKENSIDYVVPNMYQCKGCHVKGTKFKPIGPTARQLNKQYDYGDVYENQLLYWYKKDLINFIPEPLEIPKIADWDDSNNFILEKRARAWLDINCAHCHNSNGPARTSGLFLDYYENNPKALGIYKTPVAAGRGAGNLKYDIVPGDPDNSILVYRLESIVPGIMMPELGRSLVHEEGLELIREWILSIKE